LRSVSYARIVETAQSMLMRTLIGEAVDEARVGVVVYDDNGSYIAANRAMCEVLGYTLDELLALRPVDVSARSEKTVAKGLAALLSDGSASGTARLRRKDGTVVAGRYVAARTTVARLDYYVSIFEPTG
jgi:PAS domain S-box-containing protein